MSPGWLTRLISLKDQGDWPWGCAANNSPSPTTNPCEKEPKMYMPFMPGMESPRYTFPPMTVVALPPEGCAALLNTMTGSTSLLPRMSTSGQEASSIKLSAALQQEDPSFTFHP